MSTTIRVSEDTRDRFARPADSSGCPMAQLLDEAADALEHRLFFFQLTDGFGPIRNDEAAWGSLRSSCSFRCPWQP